MFIFEEEGRRKNYPMRREGIIRREKCAKDPLPHLGLGHIDLMKAVCTAKRLIYVDEILMSR